MRAGQYWMARSHESMVLVRQALLRCSAFSSSSPAEYFEWKQHHGISARKLLNVNKWRKQFVNGFYSTGSTHAILFAYPPFVCLFIPGIGLRASAIRQGCRAIPRTMGRDCSTGPSFHILSFYPLHAKLV
jgi:hypothetical protein